MLKIEFEDGIYKVILDGADISNSVQSMKIDLEAGKAPKIEATVTKDRVVLEFEGEEIELV